MEPGSLGVFGFKSSGDVVPKKSSNIYSDDSVNRRKELDNLANKALARVIDNITVNTQNADSFQKKVVHDQITETIEHLLEDSKQHLSHSDKQKAVSYVMDEIFGYGPITPLLEDKSVSEVMVNGPDSIFVEKSGKIEKTNCNFRDNKHIMHTIDKIIAPIGRRVDESSPMVDARLPDGSRVNIIIPPLALKGPTITIRKFAVDPFKLEDLITFGTLNHDMSKLLRACVKGRINILISGGTGSGKTTFLNVISSFVPHDERIVTIEDAAELQLQQEHVVILEGRPANNEGKGRVSIRDLVVNSLRMRPDRIIVGEVRSGEALDMLQAMNTGHDGSITTVHANNPRDSLSRLETMVMMSGVELPSQAIREQISSAIGLIIQISRFNDGSRKVINVTEVTGMEGENISLQDIYVFKQSGVNEKGKVVGKLLATGLVPTFLEKLKTMGEHIPLSVFRETDFQQRRRT